MDIEKEILNIVENKQGNKEIAIFYEDGEWIFYLGNQSKYVMLGEVAGEIETSGDSLENIIVKMKQKQEYSGVLSVPPEEDCYVIYKMAIYGHGVYGVFFDFESAKGNCLLAASNDRDNYHEYKIYVIKTNCLFEGDDLDDGFMEKDPIFSCKKLST